MPSSLQRLVLVLALAGGCGGASPTVASPTLTAPAEVAAGTVVTIAPGASLAAPKDATLTVRGRLTLESGPGPRARIAPAVAGQTWGGIIVESGGTLEVHGLDLDGVTTAIEVKAGAARALYDRRAVPDHHHPVPVAP